MSHHPDAVWVSIDRKTEVLAHRPGRFTVGHYYVDEQLSPVRGYNKLGRLVWRTYKTCDEALVDIGRLRL